MEKENNCIGLMSGTSCDGLDIALCSFIETGDIWNYEIIKAITVSFPAELKNRLVSAPDADAFSLSLLDVAFGKWCGEQVHAFTSGLAKKPLLVASHGHTVFHQPELDLSLQIGKGQAIARFGGLPVVSDFRPLDVLHGGQGAPLVPIGDALLFGGFSHCLNLGGFANISCNSAENKRLAWDICPANIVLNRLSQQLGHDFDENGKLGREGELYPKLLEKLNALPYYQQTAPKSLGKEWVDEHINPLLSEYLDAGAPPRHVLRTFYEHITQQISASIGNSPDSNVLISGGGAYNGFLLELLSEKCPAGLHVPDNQIVDYKEALVFAFMGLLCWQGKPNILSAATGADQDVCSGLISMP